MHYSVYFICHLFAKTYGQTISFRFLEEMENRREVKIKNATLMSIWYYYLLFLLTLLMQLYPTVSTKRRPLSLVLSFLFKPFSRIFAYRKKKTFNLRINTLLWIFLCWPEKWDEWKRLQLPIRANLIIYSGVEPVNRLNQSKENDNWSIMLAEIWNHERK